MWISLWKSVKLPLDRAVWHHWSSWLSTSIATSRLSKMVWPAQAVFPCPISDLTFIWVTNNRLFHLPLTGEYSDGESNTVYNDVFRWNVETGEWRQIISPNTPPPRCSHQAVLYRDHLYVFGGEFATVDQFYHYRVSKPPERYAKALKRLRTSGRRWLCSHISQIPALFFVDISLSLLLMSKHVRRGRCAPKTKRMEYPYQ